MGIFHFLPAITLAGSLVEVSLVVGTLPLCLHTGNRVALRLMGCPMVRKDSLHSIPVKVESPGGRGKTTDNKENNMVNEEISPQCPIAEGSDLHTRFIRQVNTNPRVWKDWVALVGMVFTIGTMLLQGGRILERLDRNGEQLKEINATDMRLYTELGVVKSDVGVSRGEDMVQAEQIRRMDSRLAEIEAQERREHAKGSKHDN